MLQVWHHWMVSLFLGTESEWWGESGQSVFRHEYGQSLLLLFGGILSHRRATVCLGMEAAVTTLSHVCTSLLPAISLPLSTFPFRRTLPPAACCPPSSSPSPPSAIWWCGAVADVITCHEQEALHWGHSLTFTANTGGYQTSGRCGVPVKYDLSIASDSSVLSFTERKCRAYQSSHELKKKNLAAQMHMRYHWYLTWNISGKSTIKSKPQEPQKRDSKAATLTVKTVHQVQQHLYDKYAVKRLSLYTTSIYLQNSISLFFSHKYQISSRSLDMKCGLKASLFKIADTWQTKTPSYPIRQRNEMTSSWNWAERRKRIVTSKSSVPRGEDHKKAFKKHYIYIHCKHMTSSWATLHSQWSSHESGNRFLITVASSKNKRQRNERAFSLVSFSLSIKSLLLCVLQWKTTAYHQHGDREDIKQTLAAAVTENKQQEPIWLRSSGPRVAISRTGMRSHLASTLELLKSPSE